MAVARQVVLMPPVPTRAGRCCVYKLVAACAMMGSFSGQRRGNVSAGDEQTVLPKPQRDEVKRGLPVNGAGGLCVGLQLVWLCAHVVCGLLGGRGGVCLGVAGRLIGRVCVETTRKQANAHGASPQRRKEPWAR